MIDYAVTNPATGEQIKTYPTITDAELEAARADAPPRAKASIAAKTMQQR
jgi:succinate-semialdehyde dehydrogenase/glutarate-semialdehyde dehydrogenase